MPNFMAGTVQSELNWLYLYFNILTLFIHRQLGNLKMLCQLLTFVVEFIKSYSSKLLFTFHTFSSK